MVRPSGIAGYPLARNEFLGGKSSMQVSRRLVTPEALVGRSNDRWPFSQPGWDPRCPTTSRIPGTRGSVVHATGGQRAQVSRDGSSEGQEPISR